MTQCPGHEHDTNSNRAHHSTTTHDPDHRTTPTTAPTALTDTLLVVVTGHA